MKWASALSRDSQADGAVTRALEVLDQELGVPPDLLFVFVSAPLLSQAPVVLARLRERFPLATLIGCGASGVIGAGREVEDAPALSLIAASLPGVTVEACALKDGEAPAFVRPPRAVFLFADPFTFEPERCCAAIDESFAGAVTTGGLASGGSSPGSHRLFLDERLFTSGAVCVGLSGALEVEALVAQGTRPLAPPMFATGVDGHLLLEVDGKAPLDVLQRLHDAAPEDQRERMRHALVVGVGMKTGKLEQSADELLVRNLVGLDRARKAVAVASTLEPFQPVQFLLRDREAADAELKARIAGVRSAPAAALLFSCTGRGQGLFGVADHDSGLFRERFPSVPLGGFFCNGEVGPVNGRTWVHGFTSVFLLVRPTG